MNDNSSVAPARLSDLVAVSRRLAETRKRLEKTALIADLLRGLAPEEVPVAVAYLSGELPQGRVGLGYAALSAARAETAASEPSLVLAEVDTTFQRVKAVSGPGSTDERARLVRELLARATREEQDFLVRLVLGELRQGALEGLVAEAVARATRLPAASVRRALMLSGELGPVARAALAEGTTGLAAFGVRLFRPLQPMLAQSAEDVAEALARLGRAALEFKLDGARVQVHKQGEQVRVFTRGLNEVTAATPELVELVRRLPDREAILDGETLALRPDGRPHPFQVTMRRFGRKGDDAETRAAWPLTTFFFDCLYLDGASLLERPASERAAALAAAVAPEHRVPRLETDDPAAGEAFAREAFARGHEGLMAKALDAPYEAGARGAGWLKLKRALSLDLVVLAAEWGSGRRQGRLSNLHLGARAAGGFVMLGKTFKGLTDAMLAWQTERLLALETERDRWTVYVRPELVVEIAFNDLQQSPQYPGGLALRFARVKRYRPDKAASEADTFETVKALYEAQTT